MLKVLAVDDDEDALFVLKEVLGQGGFEVFTAEDGKAGVEAAEKLRPDLILLDINMPKLDGIQATKIIKAHAELRYVPVILLTAKESDETLISGLEAGANDYIRKPYDRSELLARIKTALRIRELYETLRAERGTVEVLRAEMRRRAGFGELVGSSPVMEELYRMMERVCATDVPVLITGETGTGKELVARAIHFEGKRAKGPFIAQNCSAFQETLLESELFGYVKGAFTGAVKDKAGLFDVADGGTLFLDELGEMPLSLQAKLLRVLQDGVFTPVGGVKPRSVDVRVVCATNRDLQGMISSGGFREDLFYRVAVIVLKVPALRERLGDIPAICEALVEKRGKKLGVSGPVKFGDGVMRALMSYEWPGNVRQLQNEVERLLVLAAGGEIKAEHLSIGGAVPQTAGGGLKDIIAQVERREIEAALKRSGWNQSAAAAELQISRTSLITKMKAFNLERIA